MCNDNILPLKPLEENVSDSVTGLRKNAAKEFISQAVNAEIEELLAKNAGHQVDRKQTHVRNGQEYVQCLPSIRAVGCLFSTLFSNQVVSSGITAATTDMTLEVTTRQCNYRRFRNTFSTNSRIQEVATIPSVPARNVCKICYLVDY